MGGLDLLVSHLMFGTEIPEEETIEDLILEEMGEDDKNEENITTSDKRKSRIWTMEEQNKTRTTR